MRPRAAREQERTAFPTLCVRGNLSLSARRIAPLPFIPSFSPHSTDSAQDFAPLRRNVESSPASDQRLGRWSSETKSHDRFPPCRRTVIRQRNYRRRPLCLEIRLRPPRDPFIIVTPVPRYGPRATCGDAAEAQWSGHTPYKTHRKSFEGAQLKLPCRSSSSMLSSRMST